MKPTEENTNICIIGAGISGVCAAIQLQRLLNIKTFTIYDTQADVGGVWRANRYPGCGNDIPCLAYMYSFEYKTDWKRSYASSQETCEYLQDLAMKYDLYSRMKFRTEVKSLVWKEELKKWNVNICRNGKKSQESIFYDIVIVATGHFHKPYYPPEFSEFKGPLVHTAEWDPKTKLKNLDIAVIGSGASAMQLIPNIVDQVKTLYSYQRRPVWNCGFCRPDFEIPRSAKFIFSHFPFVVSIIRFLLVVLYLAFVPFLRTDWNLGKRARELLVKLLKKQFGNTAKANDLIPNYSLGCKRVCTHSDYYPAMKQHKVKLIRNPISKVTGDSIITEDGAETKIDVLILATGFEVQKYFYPLEVIGRHEENILETWINSKPSTYFGIFSHSTPNLFMLQGPATDSGSIPANTMIELQVEFMIRILSEKIKRKSTCFFVKAEAEQKFMKDLRYWFQNKIQGAEDCGSYYTNSRNEPTTLWPLTAASYWFKTRFAKFSNFEFIK